MRFHPIYNSIDGFGTTKNSVMNRKSAHYGLSMRYMMWIHDEIINKSRIIFICQLTANNQSSCHQHKHEHPGYLLRKAASNSSPSTFTTL